MIRIEFRTPQNEVDKLREDLEYWKNRCEKAENRLTDSELLDEARHALFHLDIRTIKKYLPKEEVEQAYNKACENAEQVMAKIKYRLDN